ncbi:hypothetical protein [Nostoc sp. NMS7]|nr:hypothetical protein [Nostoc sp. NMS7]
MNQQTMPRSHIHQYFYVGDRIPFNTVPTRVCQMTLSHQIKPPT